MLYFCSQTLVSLERRPKFLEGRSTRPESLTYPGRACPKAKATYGCPRGRRTNGHQRTELSSNKTQVFQVNNDLEELPLEYDRLWMIMDTYGWLSGCFDVVDFRDVVHTAWPPNVRCHLTKCRYGGALSVWVTKIRFCHSHLLWPQMADLGILGHSVIKKQKNLSVKTVMNRCTWLQMIVMIMSGLCVLRWDESNKPQSTYSFGHFLPVFPSVDRWCLLMRGSAVREQHGPIRALPQMRRMLGTGIREAQTTWRYTSDH